MAKKKYPKKIWLAAWWMDEPVRGNLWEDCGLYMYDSIEMIATQLDRVLDVKNTGDREGGTSLLFGSVDKKRVELWLQGCRVARAEIIRRCRGKL